MTDNKSLFDGRDRNKVSASDDYEVRHFAERHGISIEQARALIERHGNDRKALEEAAERAAG